MTCSYAPGILTTSQLMQCTINQLEKEGKVKGIDYEVPSKSHFDYQFTSNNQFKVTSGKSSGIIPFIKKLQARNARDDLHPCGHYVAAFKRMWQYNSSFIHQLILDYLYKDGRDKVPTLQPIDAFWKIGVDDKTSIPVGRYVPVASVQKQSSRAPMLPGIELLATDHDWCCEKLIPSVIQLMNNSADPGELLFSGGPNGNGRTFVSFHDRTLDPSSSMNAIAFINN